VTAADTHQDAWVAEFASAGFVVKSGVISHDLRAALTADADDLIARFAGGYRSADFWCYDTPSETILYRVHNLEAQGAPRITGLFRESVLHDLAARFLGGTASATVCAMVVKTRGVAGVPWHRDRTNVSPGDALNLSVYLDPSHRGNGCFEAVPSSHLLPDDADVTATRDAGPRVLVPAGPGDVLVHDVRLIHGSGDNADGVERRSIIIEFAVPGSPA
jgi:phytanoyl-CoA hydroxylase